MKKRRFIVLLGCMLAAVVCLASGPVIAAETEPRQEELSVEDYLLEESWADFFDSQTFSWQELKGKSLPQIADSLWQAVQNSFRAPLRLALRVVGVLLLLGLLRILFKENASPELDYTMQSVITVTVFLMFSTPVLQLLEDTRAALEACRLFLAQFIPVMASVLAAGGQTGTAAVYSTIFYSVIMAVSQVLYSWVAPLIRIFLALSITKGLCGSLQLEGLIQLLRRLIHWVMGLAATLFGAYLSFQTLIANTGDSLAMRAGKFVLSGGIPIVGGAVSDAIGTVCAGLRLVKNAAGIVAAVALLVMFLPMLLKCLCYGLVCQGCAAVAQLLENKPAKGLMEGMADSIRMLGAVIVLFLMMMILSVALAMLLTTGAV